MLNRTYYSREKMISMYIFKHIKKLLVFALVFTTSVNAAEWQWSTKLNAYVSPETNDFPRAFLWIPPQCKQVQAVIVGQHNMLEEGIFEHAGFRQKMSKLGIAQLWITPGISYEWDSKANFQQIFDQLLDSLAEISGYSELKFAPIIPIGHSAMATFPWNFAAQNPKRTLAVISLKGDAPNTNLTGYGRANLDWSNFDISGIPGLMIMGEYEWWDARLQPALDYKKTHTKSCVSFLCDAGRGHFDYSEQLVHYLALFIEKSVKYRLPKNSKLNEIVTLISVNPENGWLLERWYKDSIPYTKAATFTKFKGNKNNAFWYFDKEMIRETERINARQRAKKEQYIGFVQNEKLLTFDPKSHARINARFEPEADGLTFHVKAVFTDTLRTKIVKDHAKGNAVITRICGSVRKVSDTTFTVQFYRMGLNNSKRTGDIWLIAANDGDKNYKSTVQQLNIRIPYRNVVGKQQQITFDSIPDINQTIKSVDLHAVSDSGLPVCFYIREGPAEIKDGKLVLRKIPPRTKFPVKVTVVAWQYGRSVEPKVQTANPEIREFYIKQ